MPVAASRITELRSTPTEAGAGAAATRIRQALAAAAQPCGSPEALARAAAILAAYPLAWRRFQPNWADRTDVAGYQLLLSYAAAMDLIEARTS